MSDEQFMRAAMQEADKARKMAEVPVGAVIVHDGAIIAAGHRQRATSQTSLSHAEVIAVAEPNTTVRSWRRQACTFSVTLEPCPMCAGAMVQSRVKRVVYGASDPKAGCAGTLMNLLQDERFNHQVELTSGVLEQECGDLLKNFFRALRDRSKLK